MIRASRGSRMNLRHAAALALVGWYLMIPPPMDLSDGSVVPDLSAPLSRWLAREPFRTADDCTAELEVMRLRGEQVRREEHYPRSDLYEYTSRCVRSDDPRLKEK